MEQFIDGKSYLIVKAQDWHAFVAKCAVAELKWGKNRRGSISDMPYLLKMKGKIGALVRDKSIYLSDTEAPRDANLPVEVFAQEPDRIMVFTDGHGTDARFYAGQTLVKHAEAMCDPRDDFRLGPGAILAIYRGLDAEDRHIARMLLVNEGNAARRPERNLTIRIDADTSMAAAGIEALANRLHALMEAGMKAGVAFGGRVV